MINIILGAGQVGNAVKSILKGEVKLYDKGQWENGVDNIENNILHICIPFSDNFRNIVRHSTRIFKPLAVIIHSTVKPYTTSRIGFNDIIYSPINGRHGDKFERNIRNYPKLMAGSRDAYRTVKKHFNIKTVYLGDDTAELEYAKVMCTTYMYWNIVYEKSIYKDCADNGFIFETVYTYWNELYNKGIKKKHRNWQRPIYMHDNNKQVGGHCLRPNIHLWTNRITKFLKQYEKSITKYITFTRVIK